MIMNKKGVSVRGIQPEIVHAINVANSIISQFGKDCVVTAGTDGKHMGGSLHYVGLAVDLRTRDLNAKEKAVFVYRMKTALGAEYDVVPESTHLHIEYQPKTPTSRRNP